MAQQVPFYDPYSHGFTPRPYCPSCHGTGQSASGLCDECAGHNRSEYEPRAMAEQERANLELWNSMLRWRDPYAIEIEEIRGEGHGPGPHDIVIQDDEFWPGYGH